MISACYAFTWKIQSEVIILMGKSSFLSSSLLMHPCWNVAQCIQSWGDSEMLEKKEELFPLTYLCVCGAALGLLGSISAVFLVQVGGQKVARETEKRSSIASGSTPPAVPLSLFCPPFCSFHHWLPCSDGSILEAVLPKWPCWSSVYFVGRHFLQLDCCCKWLHWPSLKKI